MRSNIIVPLNLGTIKDSEKSFLTARKDPGVKIDFVCIMWAIRCGKKTIIVDTGPSDPEWSITHHDRKLIRKPQETVEGALSFIDVTPDQIETVINTHLHWDHCYNNGKFKNAIFIVQREELRYAASPLPIDFRVYEMNTNTPTISRVLGRCKAVEGDCDLGNGIRLILTPGHSPGSQSVAVETEKGVYVIAGDAVSLYENWESNPRIPPAICCDLEAQYRSFEKIARIGQFVLPGHDPKVFDHPSYP